MTTEQTDLPRAHICIFASALGDMYQRDQGDPVAVLRILKDHPRFTCFDASANQTIANTMTRLLTDDLITYPQPQPNYPWARVALTDKGRARLNGEPPCKKA